MSRDTSQRRTPRPRGDADASPAGTEASSASTPARRQPAIPKDHVKPSKKFAEVAGGTAAGCAAVCCCCPCGLVNLLFLTVVRLPAALCRKALRKQRMKRKVAAGGSKKKGAGHHVPQITVTSPDEDDGGGTATASSGAEEVWPARPPPAEAAEMEMKMWAEFYSTGFWRSTSQREER